MLEQIQLGVKTHLYLPKQAFRSGTSIMGSVSFSMTKTDKETLKKQADMYKDIFLTLVSKFRDEEFASEKKMMDFDRFFREVLKAY